MGPGTCIWAAGDIINVTEEPVMLSHYDLHRRILDREKELLEKRALYEAQVDDALAAIRLARRDQAAAGASRRPARWFSAARPVRWAMLRLSQSWGQP